MADQTKDPPPLQNTGHFGPSVIGEEQFEKEQAMKEEGRDVFGPAVFGDAVDDRDEGEVAAARIEAELETEVDDAGLEAIEAAGGEDGYISVADLEELLDSNPELADRMLQGELQRPKGPRKGALRKFLALEINREGGPRPDVFKTIETAIQTFDGGGD